MFSEPENNDNITAEAIMVFLYFPILPHDHYWQRGDRGERKIHFLSHSSVFKAFALHFPWAGTPLAVSCSSWRSSFEYFYFPPRWQHRHYRRHLTANPTRSSAKLCASLQTLADVRVCVCLLTEDIGTRITTKLRAFQFFFFCKKIVYLYPKQILTLKLHVLLHGSEGRWRDASSE
jgi:hypothetical protein